MFTILMNKDSYTAIRKKIKIVYFIKSAFVIYKNQKKKSPSLHTKPPTPTPLPNNRIRKLIFYKNTEGKRTSDFNFKTLRAVTQQWYKQSIAVLRESWLRSPLLLQSTCSEWKSVISKIAGQTLLLLWLLLDRICSSDTISW